MPLKTSKPPKLRLSLWKAEPGCVESKTYELATKLAHELKAGDRVLLEGPLGAGKSTFARALLQGLGVKQPPEGSPTFAIAHEYQTHHLEVIHIDFYRLKSESEIEDTGIPSYFWERSGIVITEWLSSWPEFERKVLESGKAWKVSLGFVDQDRRDIRIEKIQAAL